MCLWEQVVQFLAVTPEVAGSSPVVSAIFVSCHIVNTPTSRGRTAFFAGNSRTRLVQGRSARIARSAREMPSAGAQSFLSEESPFDIPTNKPAIHRAEDDRRAWLPLSCAGHRMKSKCDRDARRYGWAERSTEGWLGVHDPVC